MATWTAPHFGVSHLQPEGKKSHATICDRGRFVDVSLWFPGCGFSPINEMAETVEAAKARCEAWLKEAA